MTRRAYHCVCLLLQYRIDRFAGAASKARSQGYAGLMMPCESAYSGYEVQGEKEPQITLTHMSLPIPCHIVLLFCGVRFSGLVSKI